MTPAVLRAQVENALPGALTTYIRPEPETIPTGIAAIDRQIGGIAKGALTQRYAPQWTSAGKTTILLSCIAHLINRGCFCALVDASNCFDPASAQASGVNLAHLLWVRCTVAGGGKGRALRPLEQAFKATDILVQNGGFSLIAVDLSSIEESQIRKVPATTWFRFARVVERMPTALVFLVTHPAAQSCAGLTLQLGCKQPSWSVISEHSGKYLSHGQFVRGLQFEFEVMRSRKPMQSVRSGFSASPSWT